MSRTRALVTALLVSSALALTGCSDDPKPKFAPSPSPVSPSATGTAASSAPKMPAEARGTGAAAAVAFVKFYWATVNYAQASKDLASLRALGAHDCNACTAGVKFLEKAFAHNATVSGGDATVSKARSRGYVRENRRYSNALVDFTLVTSPQHVDYPGDSKDQDFPGGSTAMRAVLRPADGGGWVMRAWTVR